MHETVDPAGRVVRCEMVIQAEADVVWRALVDAGELARWFPVAAEVDARVGGTVTFHWNDIYPAMTAAITAMENGRLLRIGDPTGASAMATEYTLESRERETLLRVVQSGFFGGGSWDDLYDGTRRGWEYELRALRHYLQRHRGHNRRVVWLIRHPRVQREEIWTRLAAPDAFDLGKLAGAEEGDRFSIAPAGGPAFAGTVALVDIPWQFGGVIDAWNDALMRISLDPHPSGFSVNLLVGFYGCPPELIAAVEKRCARILDDIFPAG